MNFLIPLIFFGTANYLSAPYAYRQSSTGLKELTI